MTQNPRMISIEFFLVTEDNINVQFQKISLPPHGRDVVSKTPTPLEIPIKLHTFLEILWSYRTPPPRIFQPLLWEEYGYSLELYNTKSGSSNNKSKNSKSLKHLRANLNGTALSYMYVTSYTLFLT